jgi:hypothetical protein
LKVIPKRHDISGGNEPEARAEATWPALVGSVAQIA